MRELEASLQQFGDFILKARWCRTRPHRTECSYGDWARRFLSYIAEREGVQRPWVDAQGVRDYLTHLAVRQGVSASTQNQALCALLFLCREVLGLEPEGVALAARAKQGKHLPIVLSIPETAALLGALRGTTWLMAVLWLTNGSADAFWKSARAPMHGGLIARGAVA